MTSYVITQPEVVARATGELGVFFRRWLPGLRPAEPTTGGPAPGDQVSALTVAAHAHASGGGAQAAVHDLFLATLRAGAGPYEANLKPLFTR
jgi:hypothetical protein